MHKLNVIWCSTTDDMMISELYKDQQCQEMYSLLDKVALHNRDVVNNVKCCFMNVEVKWTGYTN